jgi:hypothetical protein
LVIPIDRDPLRTVGGDLIKPIDYRGVTPMLAATTVTGHSQHIELADEITEDDCRRRETLAALMSGL